MANDFTHSAYVIIIDTNKITVYIIYNITV